MKKTGWTGIKITAALCIKYLFVVNGDCLKTIKSLNNLNSAIVDELFSSFIFKQTKKLIPKKASF